MSKTSQLNRDSRFGIALLVKQDTSINLTSPWLKKESLEENQAPGVVLKMTESLQSSHYIFFYNFCPSLIAKLYERGLYSVGTAQKGKKGIPEMPVDRKAKRFRVFLFQQISLL